MTNTDILVWIKKNLALFIIHALNDTRLNQPNLIYTEDWLAAITCRETGGLIAKYAPSYNDAVAMAPLMKGDWGKRDDDVQPIYHGFGYTQEDIASFPDFVASGKWKDPFENYLKCISILESKRMYLLKHLAVIGDDFNRAITAAYNCGEGNVKNALNARPPQDVDIHTANHNYSSQVWEFREIYRNLPD